MSNPNPTMFGDYSLTKANGRWTAACYHCRYRSTYRGFAGYAERSLVAHLSAVHRLVRIRRDARETWLR